MWMTVKSVVNEQLIYGSTGLISSDPPIALSLLENEMKQARVIEA